MNMNISILHLFFFICFLIKMYYLDHLLECPIGPSLKVVQLRYDGFLTGPIWRPLCLNFSALPAIHVLRSVANTSTLDSVSSTACWECSLPSDSRTIKKEPQICYIRGYLWSCDAPSFSRFTHKRPCLCSPFETTRHFCCRYHNHGKRLNLF